MKETEKSLRAYFIIVGILGLLSLIISKVLNPEISIGLFSIIELILGAMFIYFGIKMNKYLQDSPKTLVMFVYIAFGITTISHLVVGNFIFAIIPVLIGWYFVKNIKKLSM